MSKKYTLENLSHKLSLCNDQFIKGEIKLLEILPKQRVRVSDKWGELITRYTQLLVNQKLTIQSAIDKDEYWRNIAKDIRGDKYDYSLVNYVNSRSKIKIICKEDGKIFEQAPASHLRGNGCPYCANNGVKPSDYGSRKEFKAEYRAYYAMLSRCYNTSNRKYKNYGGRGIKVCERWLESFDNFIEDMGKRTTISHSLERNDVNGNYEPSNCRWATNIEQANNKTISAYIKFKHKKITIADFIKDIGGTSYVYTQLKTKTPEEVVEFYKPKKQI